jgi:hypothetical protein
MLLLCLDLKIIHKVKTTYGTKKQIQSEIVLESLEAGNQTGTAEMITEINWLKMIKSDSMSLHDCLKQV